MATDIDDIIRQFSLPKEKKQKPILQHKNKFLLIGFKSDIKKITLDENNIIRQGSKKELQKYYKEFELGEGVHEYKHFLEYTDQAEVRFSFHPELIKKEMEINVFFDVLCLTEVKAPFVERYIRNPNTNSYESAGLQTNTRIRPYSNKKIELKRDNLSVFKQRWRKLSGITNTSFYIALKRYYFAKGRYEEEDKLVDLLIAFEAMFLTENGESSYRLALRVSILLKKHYNSVSLFDFMKKAYNLRSKVVHGSEVKKKDLTYEGRELTMRLFNLYLSNILKDCLFLYVMEHNNLSTSDFMEKVDNSLFD